MKLWPLTALSVVFAGRRLWLSTMNKSQESMINQMLE